MCAAAASGEPMVSTKLALRNLAAEYSGKSSAEYRTKAKSLAKEYSSYRQVKRDGNCFYRGYAFGLFESALYMLRGTFIYHQSVLVINTFWRTINTFNMFIHSFG